MDFKLPLTEIKTPEDVAKLTGALSELADSLDVLVSTTAPNGNISGRQGQICLYNNSGTYTTWINTTGSTVWQQIDAETTLPFQTGDWIISSVTTARTGWTDKSATYSNKFMRINATPLSTGGADTHTHTFTLAEANIPAHTHNVTTYDNGTDGVGVRSAATSGTTRSVATSSIGSTLQATTDAGDNVPAYVQVCIFEKN